MESARETGGFKKTKAETLSSKSVRTDSLARWFFKKPVKVGRHKKKKK